MTSRKSQHPKSNLAYASACSRRRAKAYRAGNLFAILMVALLGIAAIGLIVMMVQNNRTADRRLLESFANCDHGDTLEEFIAEVRSAEIEVMAYFTAEGQKILEYTFGDENEVSVPPGIELAALREGGVVHVHNHPVECPHSDNDLVNKACQRKDSDGIQFAAVVVVSPEYVYVVQPGEAGWPTPEEAFGFLMVDFPREASFQEHVEQGYFVKANDLHYATTPKLVRLYTDHFGLTYTRYDY